MRIPPFPRQCDAFLLVDIRQLVSSFDLEVTCVSVGELFAFGAPASPIDHSAIRPVLIRGTICAISQPDINVMWPMLHNNTPMHDRGADHESFRGCSGISRPTECLLNSCSRESKARREQGQNRGRIWLFQPAVTSSSVGGFSFQKTNSIAPHPPAHPSHLTPAPRVAGRGQFDSGSTAAASVAVFSNSGGPIFWQKLTLFPMRPFHSQNNQLQISSATSPETFHPLHEELGSS